MATALVLPLLAYKIAATVQGNRLMWYLDVSIALATFALLNDGMDIHTLAIQMGTSIAMIERHYSHLTPRLRKEMLTGKRYELSRDQYEEKVLE